MDIENISIEKDGDIIFCTVGMYKLFLANDALDAFLMYMHLMFTARLQETNQVWANQEYLQKGLGWGRDRVKKAKSMLSKLGLIEYVQHHHDDAGTDGRVAPRYSRECRFLHLFHVDCRLIYGNGGCRFHCYTHH